MTVSTGTETAETASLWRQYLEAGSEAAFAELVRRHIDLVYSVALRRCGGDTALAEDVAQTVFVDLARKALRLPRDLVLAGWLYRHAAFVASTVVRTETRRRRREQLAMEFHDPGDGVDWSELAPVLDDAMDELSERDRNAIVLRCLDHQPFADVGRSLGIGADAARMRVERALDRLREGLARRGVTSTSAALALGLGQNGVVAAPAGLAASVVGSAVQATLTTVPTGFIGFMMTSKISLGLAAVIAVGATTGVYLQHRNNQAMRAELEALRASVVLSQSAVERTDGPSPAEIDALRGDRLKLMALRDEIGRLREEQRRMATLEAENEQLRRAKSDTRPASDEDEAPNLEAQIERGLALARLNFAKAWTLAFLLYAGEHDDKLPESFKEAASFFPKELAEKVSVIDPERFEVVYQGSLKEITNPSRTIIIREREPFTSSSGGTGERKYMKTYAFADGHSEIHTAPDGDFESWENARMISTSQPP